MRILDGEAVGRLLDEESVFEAIRDLFTVETPDTVGYTRVDLGHPNGWLRALPAYVVGDDLLGFKVLHRTQGVGMRYTIYVHRLGTGELAGIVDGLEITNLRTGMVSALATDHLARPDIEVAAIVGTGPVGRGQLRALQLVRPAAVTRVFARTRENRRAFISEMGDVVPGELVEAATLEEAIDGAGLVTLATKAAEPVLVARHLEAGMHVNSVGPASRDRVEVDPALFARFDRVVCDSVDLVFHEAGDAHLAAAEHGFDRDAADDLGDVVSGRAEGRRDDDQVTLFKSVGNGAQDLVAAARILELAEAGGIGTVVPDINAVKPGPT